MGEFIFDRVDENGRHEGEECSITLDGRLLNSKEAVLAFCAELEAEREAERQAAGGAEPA